MPASDAAASAQHVISRTKVHYVDADCPLDVERYCKVFDQFDALHYYSCLFSPVMFAAQM